MNVIDTSHYACTRGLGLLERAQGLSPETVCFKSALELAAYLSRNPDESNFVRRCIEKKLAADETFKKMMKDRDLLKNLPCFRAYRKSGKHYNGHDRINACLQRSAKGQEISDRDKETIANLSAEIDRSPLVIPRGQVVFYGTGDDGSLHGGAPYAVPHFLSTTLCMTVADSHACRKSWRMTDTCDGGFVLQRTVMAIRLDNDFPAIFACTDQPLEYELLFDCGGKLYVDEVYRWDGGSFEYVEAWLHSIEGNG